MEHFLQHKEKIALVTVKLPHLQEVLDKASALAHEGDELIQNSHYSEDSIQPKCTNLRSASEDVSRSLKAKKDLLLKALELHHRLERVRELNAKPQVQTFCYCFLFPFFSVFLQASKWCDEGIYLLASQSVDRCQSHEGAEIALQELERHLDNAGQNQLTDLSYIWSEYETVLNQQFRVRGLSISLSNFMAIKSLFQTI